VHGIKFLSFILMLSFALAACSYRAGYGDRAIPGGYREIAVPVFKNTTHEAGIEVFFTNAMIRELERARVGVVTDKREAQATLEGIVGMVEYLGSGSPLSPDKRKEIVLNPTYRIQVVTTIRLRRNSDEKVLWEGSFSKEMSYKTPSVLTPGLTSVNAIYNHSAHYQYIEVMAADMMAEAHDRLTENF
jgi:hypothetical protein